MRNVGLFFCCCFLVDSRFCSLSLCQSHVTLAGGNVGVKLKKSRTGKHGKRGAVPFAEMFVLKARRRLRKRENEERRKGLT